MKDPRQIIQKPVITEKSTIERELSNIVTFSVDLRANKIEIKSGARRRLTPYFRCMLRIRQ